MASDYQTKYEAIKLATVDPTKALLKASTIPNREIKTRTTEEILAAASRKFKDNKVMISKLCEAAKEIGDAKTRANVFAKLYDRIAITFPDIAYNIAPECADQSQKVAEAEKKRLKIANSTCSSAVEVWSLLAQANEIERPQTRTWAFCEIGSKCSMHVEKPKEQTEIETSALDSSLKEIPPLDDDLSVETICERDKKLQEYVLKAAVLGYPQHVKKAAGMMADKAAKENVIVTAACTIAVINLDEARKLGSLLTIPQRIKNLQESLQVLAQSKVEKRNAASLPFVPVPPSSL